MHQTPRGESEWAGIRSGSFDGSKDIYNLFADMRRDAPVWQAPWGDVYVSRYDLVAACLSNRRLSHAPPTAADIAPNSALRNWLIYQEGGTHTAIKAALQKPFAAKGLSALRPYVEEAIDLHIGSAAHDGETEIVTAFARAIPERVIGRLLGVPVDDLPLLAGWSASIRELLDIGFDDAFDSRLNAVDEMSAYFTDHARKLLEGSELPVLLTGLPALVENVGLVVAGSNLALLAFAGHETTVHLLGNMFFHLANAPEQLAKLRADPVLAAQVLAETLRLESPVQKICRWPTGTMELGGHVLEKGQLVVLLCGAANRDPLRFTEPDRFDLDRAPAQNLAFGRGLHVCIGRALAEIEAVSVLTAALRRWSTIEPVKGGARWLDNSSFRGLDRLVLRLAS